MSSSKPNPKSGSSNYSFFKALAKSFKKSSTANKEKLPFIVTPTAVGGFAEQPALINELETADNHRKLEIVLQLKRSIEDRSISSILETWIPARQILLHIDNSSSTYSNYDKLRNAVIELLYTCIQYDDLSQLSVLTRYVTDILFFCKVTPKVIDPNIKSFLRCFYLLVDNKLIENFHSLVLYITKETVGDHSSILSSDSTYASRNIELMCQRSISQFLIDILSCEALLQTKDNLKILRDFINKLNTILREDMSYIFDSHVLALTLRSMFKIALVISDLDDSHLVINQIFNFINVALGYSFIPLSLFPRVLILLFYFYNQGTKYSPIIDGIFKSLVRSDNCYHLTFAVISEIIEKPSLEEFVNFDDDRSIYLDSNDNHGYFEDYQIVSFKDSFFRTVSELDKDNNSALTYDSVEKKRRNKGLGLEKYFPLISKSLNSSMKAEKHFESLDPIELSVHVLAGTLKIIKAYIQENDFELLKDHKKQFLFDSSSYKFQGLITSLFKRLNSCSQLAQPSFGEKTETTDDKLERASSVKKSFIIPKISILTICRDVMFFFSFLLHNPIVFKSIPEDLFFYKTFDDNYSIDTSKLGSDQFLLEESSVVSDGDQKATDFPAEIQFYSIFDVLDVIYQISFESDEDYEATFSNLFKDHKSYTSNLDVLVKTYGEDRIGAILTTSEMLFFEIIHVYHQVIDDLQAYCNDPEFSNQLEPADTSEFFLKKSDILTVDNWQDLLKNYENGSEFINLDSLLFTDLMNSVIVRVFDEEKQTRRSMFQLDDPKMFDAIKLSMLQTIRSMIDFHFDFKGNNERLWPLVVCLFGIGNPQDASGNLAANKNSGGSFFNKETNPDIVQFLLDCLKHILLTLRFKYFEELLMGNVFHDIVLYNRAYENNRNFNAGMSTGPKTENEAENLAHSSSVKPSPDYKILMPYENLLGLTKLVVYLFIESSVNQNIKHGAEKAKSLYYILTSLFRWLILIFEANVIKEKFLKSEDYRQLFDLFFIVFDCLSRIRATENGNLYFDNWVREYKLLVEEQSQSKIKNNNNIELQKDLISTLLSIAKQNLIFDYVADEMFMNVSASVFVGRSPSNETIEHNDYTIEAGKSTLNFNDYFQSVINNLNGHAGTSILTFSWYSIILQLSNIPLFRNSEYEITVLRTKACSQLLGKIVSTTSLSKEDKVILQKTIIRLLLRVVVYSDLFTKDEQDQIVNSLVASLGNFGNIGVLCIHTLAVCCYQIPVSIKKFIQPILWKLQQHISNPDATPHILEFLLSLSHMPSLMTNFSIDDFKPIFGMAFRFIQTSKDLSEQNNKAEKPTVTNDNKLANYLGCLSYNVISSWFLKMKMKTRKQLAPFIIKCLLDISKEKGGDIDSRCVVLIDFIQRFTYSNLDLRFQLIKENLDINDSSITVTRWVFGISIISVLTHKVSGRTIITIRRPSGTTKFEVRPHDSMVPLQNLAEFSDKYFANSDSDGLFTSSFVFLQMLAHIFTDTDRTPLLIPDTERFNSSIKLFDMMPLIEVYKAGLIYIGPGQETEEEILLNSVGSKEYQKFLSNLGDLIRLKNCKSFYTGGLDYRNDSDGEYAYCWDDKVSQLLFHTTTLMPTKNNQSWITKKSHVGNDFVNIFFDESGKPFNFNIIRSQFTFVNIVITPVSLKTSIYSSPYDNQENEDLQNLDDDNYHDTTEPFDKEPETETYFQVKTYLKPGLPEVFSTCKMKTISSKNLPIFVRNLALIADQFAQIWNSPTVHVTNWTNRYNHLIDIKEKVKKSYDDVKEEELNKVSKSATSKSLQSTLPFLNAFNQVDKSIPDVDASSEADIKAKLFSLLDFTSYS